MRANDSEKSSYSETISSSDKSFFCNTGTRFGSDTPLRNRFDILLRRVGLSQNKLADRIKVSSSTMSYFANGIWIPSSETMIKICKELDVPTHVLYGDSPFWNRWHTSIIYNHTNADGESEPDLCDSSAGQCPAMRLNQPSDSKKDGGVDKDE